MPDTDKQPRETLWELVKDIRFALFTTRHSNGHFHGRPMTTQNKSIDEDDSLWFFMSRSNDAVDDLAAEPTVHVGYADPGRDAYVSISGEASVVEDAGRKQQLWSKMNEAWFPDGPDDPDVALVQVRIVHAEYWNVKDSKPVQLFKMAKAAVTGKPPDMGDRGHVRMN
jgi:general stress protein 26